MKTKSLKTVLNENPRHANLIRSVVRQAGGVATTTEAIYGAQNGVSGFIYYSETIPFFRRHKRQIVDLLRDYAADCAGGVIDTVKTFNGIDGNYTEDEIGEALYGRYNPALKGLYNTLTWFALEAVAHMFEE